MMTGTTGIGTGIEIGVGVGAEHRGKVKETAGIENAEKGIVGKGIWTEVGTAIGIGITGTLGILGTEVAATREAEVVTTSEIDIIARIVESAQVETEVQAGAEAQESERNQ